MTLAINAFDKCRHTKALISNIHMEWANKTSNNYGEFQKQYNTKLRELYSLEKKEITESAQHAKLKQELATLREQLPNTKDTTSTLEGNIDQLYENQCKIVGLTGEVALETEKATTGDIDTITKNVAAILLWDSKKTNDGSNTNKDKVKLPLRQYTKYCYLGGVILFCNDIGDTCNSKCPCNKKGRTGQSTRHDKTATYANRKNGLRYLLFRWNGWVVMCGSYALTKQELLDHGTYQ